MGTHAHIDRPAVFGSAVAAGPFLDLQPIAAGTYTPIPGAQIVLPERGTYKIEADVRAHVATSGAGNNVFVAARLFDVTAAAAVPDSETMAVQQMITTATGVGNMPTSVLGVFYTVAGPTTIRLEAARGVQAGATTAASIWSNTSGRTRLRYIKISD